MMIRVESRSGRTILALSLPSDATVKELQKKIHSNNKRLHPSRQRLTLKVANAAEKPKVLEEGKTLADYFEEDVVKGGDKRGVEGVIVLKDLGPQIGYSTVFVCEYAGPIFIYAAFFFFPEIFYPRIRARKVTHPAQQLALYYWTFHYTKRILETIFVHHFSRATMPIANLVRNCGYYYSFAAFVSYFINHPLYTPPPLEWTYAALGVALVCQLANFYCHVVLRSLRSPSRSGKEGEAAPVYVIPRGFLFDWITCPNYTAEILGWIFFSIATQAVASYLFMLAGSYPMAMWAIQKHRRLKKLYDGKEGRAKYPRRWVVMPPLL
eukprot:TRINITY_DN2944_c0_g1_i2.p1 TRINITY_DN2944_c0_g1~~TRINITY_DN2944_c0_g1_i2.p1  ORF type:complete len:323 (+),score=66.56 TRINITY_DN2944_c0_g1_i2:104-1072(+)